jgi:putative inorganic carbon (hco3(-)) transporter
VIVTVRGPQLSVHGRASLAWRTALGSLLLVSAILLALLPIAQSTIVVAVVTGAILCVRYPWLVWIGLGLVIPIAASSRVGGVSPTDLLVAAGVFLWATDSIAHRRWEVTHAVPLWPVALYIGLLLTSALGARDLVEAATEVIKWTEFAVILWTVPLVTPTRAAPWLVAVLLTAAATQAALGLYQFIFRIGPEWFAIQERFMRASGSFRQPNPFAGYLGLTLPVAASLLLWSLQRWSQSRSVPWATGRVLLLAGVTSLIGLGLFASWSRGGWLGAVAAAALVVALSSRRGALTVVALVSAALPASLLGMLNPNWIPAFVRERIADIPAYFGAGDPLSQPVTDANFAVLERLAHWFAAVRMWESAPWLGVGPGNYNVAYAAFGLPQWPDPLGHAHNIYLNVLAESGLLGLLSFAILWTALVIWTIRRMMRLPAHDWRRALAVGILGVYTHLAIHSLFDNLFVQGIYLHLAFWSAILSIAIPWESEDRAC